MTLKNPILYSDLIAETGNSKEMTALATRYIRTRDSQKKIDLRDKILLGCMRFIRKVTIRTVGSNSEFIEDAFQSACISFLSGLDKFKPTKRVQFLTYVYFWIVKGINDEYHSRSIIFLSKDSYKQDRFQNMHNTNLVYFDKMVNSNDENQNTSITKAMKDNKEDISSLIDRESISKRLDFIMRRCLNGTEYALIKLRYFYDEQPAYREISKFIGVSPQFLSISEKNAIAKLKKAMSIQRMPRLKKTRAKISAGMDTDAIYEYILNERIRRENEKT